MVLSSSSSYEEKTFREIEAAGEVARDVQFIECRFQGCRLPQMRFESCAFTDCVFERCDLGVIGVRNSRFQDVQFRSCKMIGVDWTKARPQSPHQTLTVTIQECVLSYSSFYGLQVGGIEILRSTAHEVDFAEADLRAAKLTGTDFQGSVFLHSNLERADLRGARNYAIDPRDNSVKRARFSLPEAISLLRGLDIVVE